MTSSKQAIPERCLGAAKDSGTCCRRSEIIESGRKEENQEDKQMVLFESYERRIDKINEVLNSYGITSSKRLSRLRRMPDLTYTTR